jgi:hypothetical protein
MLTAKQIKSVAMSVATAKKYGIKTQVADTGPQVLDQADKILSNMIKKLQVPSAPSMKYEAIYYNQSDKIAAYSTAIADLRKALEA